MQQPIGLAPSTSTPESFRSELAPVVTSARTLARSFSGKGKVIADDAIEGSAETVSEFLRQLAETPDAKYDALIAKHSASIPCPPWCVAGHDNHARQLGEADGVRECESGSESIPTLTGPTLSAEAVRFTDLITGRVRTPEVRVCDETMTPENALRVAEQIRTAVSIATGATVGNSPTQDQCKDMATVDARPGCQPWCRDATADADCGGDCTAEPVEVLATGGFIEYPDRGGVTIPLVETNARISQTGTPAVHVRISGPTDLDNQRDAWADLTPAEARRYAAAIVAQADLAEQAK
jgi:hypothetical protein